MNTVTRLKLTLSFLVLAPLVTFVMLCFKGLPPFAVGHLLQVLLWVYSMTWAPALLSGALLSGVVSSVVKKTPYFHKPYDFGRCCSLGAITGALAEAFSTWGYRLLSHHPFSGFWIAGATIAGCVTGSVLTSLFLTRVR